MRMIKIPVWWTPQEAESVISFLDQLRHEITNVYGDEIQAMHRESDKDDRLQDDWNDKVPF